MTTQAEPARGIVESVNVGTPRPVEVNGHTVLTAIWKHPVAGRVAVRGVNLDGDDQADRTVHGGPDKAVYAYAREDIRVVGGGTRARARSRRRSARTSRSAACRYPRL